MAFATASGAQDILTLCHSNIRISVDSYFADAQVTATVQNANGLDPRRDDYAVVAIDRLLQKALLHSASDLHLDAGQGGYFVRARIGGRLVDWEFLAEGQSTSLLTRVKALAQLVTYRSDIPQEGRLLVQAPSSGVTRRVSDKQHLPSSPLPVEARVSTLPTLHGERAVIRFVSRRATAWLPAELGLPEPIYHSLCDRLRERSGVILITGSAGAGKTTTAYACLRQIQAETQSNTLDPVTPRPPRAMLTLEDPIECELEGVAQSQIRPDVGYGWHDGLKALLRQDPEVLLVGEIRDPDTAAVVFQAGLAGQLVISTMHARGVADGLRRLLDMRVPAHYLRSVLSLLICQRLVPRRDHESSASAAARLLLAEMLPPIERELARAILDDSDAVQLERIACELGMVRLNDAFESAVRKGIASAW